MASPRRHCVCMICDFFYPRLGGVEMHIWSLSQCLHAKGHKVIIVTHGYGQRRGIRYMTNGIKVYYIPQTPVVDQDTLPTYAVALFPMLRQILIREQVTIVHAHQASSVMFHESMLVASTMGYKTVYTDHSLWGFAEIEGINVNKLTKFSLSNANHVICVSHTCRENTVLRASLNPRIVSTIPNAVDPTRLTPNPELRYPKDTVNIVVISRLVYRKGVDLLVRVIPAICARFPEVHFIIGGDGPKMLLLEEMRENHVLHDKVELLGAVPHRQIRDTLCRGHIFLNCSLTESFCIAMLEAACCGLFVVTTHVGGIPEVLPHDMVAFAEPNDEDLIEAVSRAVPKAKDLDPFAFHDAVKDMYSWDDVAERTAVVYDTVAAEPPVPLLERLRRVFSTGFLLGWVVVMLCSWLVLYHHFLEWLEPAATIELAPEMVPGGPRTTEDLTDDGGQGGEEGVEGVEERKDTKDWKERKERSGNRGEEKR